MTTATQAELDRQCDLMDAACDALSAGEYEKAREISKDIILLPEAAMTSFRMMGKERLLATGLNLSAANAAFGEGWLDEQPQPRHR